MIILFSLLTLLSFNAHSFIVGGTQVESATKYPFTAFVELCGGVLIHKRWILSAAHCGWKQPYITLGTIDRNDRLYVTREDGYSVGDDLRHPSRYSATNPNLHLTHYDFRLMRLSKSAKLHDKVKTIKRFSDEDAKKYFKTGVNFTVVGWGKKSEDSSEGERFLQEMTIPFVPLQVANEEISYNGALKPGLQFSAGLQQGGVDSCVGDSGGPIFTEVDGEYKLAGVVSGGRGCARVNKYGVYARITAANEWIDKMIKSYYACADGRTGIFFKSKEVITVDISGSSSTFNLEKEKRNSLIYSGYGMKIKVQKSRKSFSIRGGGTNYKCRRLIQDSI